MVEVDKYDALSNLSLIYQPEYTTYEKCVG